MVDGEQRYDRQVALFGAEGQRRIAHARVAVLGLGGLGSHVCQQLAYLGVHSFVLVDDDPVSDANLNRLIGSTAEDIGVPKTAVAARLIRSIQPTATLKAHETKLPDTDAATSLALCDLALGCFDNDYPRLVALDLASKARVPYIDAATDVSARSSPPIYGGRVLVAGTSPGCLSCLGLLDQDEIRRAQLTDEELQVEAAIYGVPVDELVGTGPSVVTINGVVASLATTEAMVLLTGLREPTKLQNYYGSWQGRITRSGDIPRMNCFYCRQWLSKG